MRRSLYRRLRDNGLLEVLVNNLLVWQSSCLRSNICNGYIVIIQLFVMIQWMRRKLMLFILFLCVNGVPNTFVYAHA